MKIGDRIEVKLTGEHGTLVDVLKYSQPAQCVVRLDSGEEIQVSYLEIRGFENKEKRRKAIKKVRIGKGLDSLDKFLRRGPIGEEAGIEVDRLINEYVDDELSDDLDE